MISIRQRRVQRLTRIRRMAERPAVGCHISIVLFEAVGEAVMPISIGNKIKEIGAFGMQSCGKRTAARIADWAGWQSGEAIGVIGRIDREIGVMKTTLVGSGQ